MRSRPSLALLSASLVVGLLCPLGAAHAWVHDANENRIDDRIEAVEAHGYDAAFVDRDRLGRKRIGVTADRPFRYLVNVGYAERPTKRDLEALRGVGSPFARPFRYIDYVRAELTFDGVQKIAALTGVRRVEAVNVYYAENHVGSRVIRARHSTGYVKTQNYDLFPSADDVYGHDGTGIVIAILDTGVNDAPDVANPLFPGHETFKGKFLGGGEFFHLDPALNTQLDESVNPTDHGGDASMYHGSHVAGTALGHGGEIGGVGVFAGMAPAARLVDCKLLTDAGASAGGAELGIEWCVFNRNNDWGLTGADSIYAGIDVINLSLGGDNSDGTDACAQMVNVAADSGIVVVAAAGNLGFLGPGIASPASADAAITVGGTEHKKTLDHEDDTIAIFSNIGLRADDGDADHLDEMKPNLVAPGLGVVSADGDFTTEGRQYKTLQGTSMASPHVAGAAALLLQADPSLTPNELRTILQNTASHAIPAGSNDPFGLDPNYYTHAGWGIPDVYAAMKEIENATSGVQVVRIHATAETGGLGAPEGPPPQISVEWWTQREYAFQGFDVWRAPDVDGSPGTFEKRNSGIVPPSPDGDPIIEADDNRTPYVYVDDDSGFALGETYWYRVDWIDTGGTSHPEPPIPVQLGERPRVATVFYSIVHNFADSDLTVNVGTSLSRDPAVSELSVHGPGEAGQDSVVLLTPGVPFFTPYPNAEHFWSIAFSDVDGVEPYLPPGFDAPWYLLAQEGGFACSQGIARTFSIFVNDSPGSETGTLYTTDSVTPQAMVEGSSIVFWIPERLPIGVPGAGASGLALRVAPHPISRSGVVTYVLGPSVAGPLVIRLFDAGGRLVRVLAHSRRIDGTGSIAWDGRDARGERLHAGVYFLTIDAGETRSARPIVVVE